MKTYSAKQADSSKSAFFTAADNHRTKILSERPRRFYRTSKKFGLSLILGILVLLSLFIFYEIVNAI